MQVRIDFSFAPLILRPIILISYYYYYATVFKVICNSLRVSLVCASAEMLGGGVASAADKRGPGHTKGQRFYGLVARPLAFVSAVLRSAGARNPKEGCL